MCVYILVGQGNDVKVEDFVDIKDKTISIEQQINDSHFSKRSTISYASFICITDKEEVKSTVVKGPEPKIVWLCPPINYCSISSLADSNKAPPYFI